MKRWNGYPQSLRPLDATLLAADTGVGAGRCRTCGRRLPLGRQRVFCLEHSAYPQQVREHLRELEAEEARAAAVWPQSAA